MAELTIGQAAPGLEPAGIDTGPLAAFRGSPVVLFFYPQDDTETCTIEAKDFSGLAKEFGKVGAIVVGVSPDSAVSHAKFKKKYGLKQELVSDEDLALAKAYGVWGEKQMFGRTYMGIIRSTFLIDGEGRIAGIWRKVRVRNHATDVLAAVRAL